MSLLDPVAMKFLSAVCPLGKMMPVIDMIHDVWNLSHERNSLYFRGSFSHHAREHPPLDIDMYYVLNSADPSLPTAQDFCLALHEQYLELPRLDLSFFTKTNLLNPEIRQMTRLILIHDGIHICGENLLPLIPPVPCDGENAEIIWFKQSKIVKKKLLGLDAEIFRTLPSDLRAYLCTSVAKSVLRLAMHRFMVCDGVFTRDVVRCAALIQKSHPELSLEVSMMLNLLQGKQLIHDQFVSHARKLFNSLGWGTDGADGMGYASKRSCSI